MIRVLVADDHAVVRRGLTGLLDNAEDMSVVGVAANGEDAVSGARESCPDVVLMDLQMPGIGGVEATRQILREGSAGDVLVLTSFSDTAGILAALDAGAVGYLLKDAEPKDLLDGIRAVARGESPIDPKAARHLLEARGRVRERSELSPREKDVLGLVLQGLPNKQIAQELGIRERTVKQHLTNAFHKIGVSDRTQAALWAQRHGL